MQVQYFSSATLSSEAVKDEYRKLVLANHPDMFHAEGQAKVDAQTEVMKAINAEFTAICSGALRNENVKTDDFKNAAGTAMHMDEISEEIAKILNSILHLDGITIDIVGCWVWLGGATYPHKDTLYKLGFKWSGTKKKWYCAPYQLKSYKVRGMFTYEKIKALHGVRSVTPEPKKQLA